MKKKNYTIVLIVTLLILISAFTACKLQVCSLQYLCGEGGSIKGNAEQSIFSGGSGSEVTAVAAEGYEFTGWSDGVKTAKRQDKNVTADITVTAQFTKIQVPEPPHTCESVCETCHKCKNADCQEEACKEKCTCQEVPLHTCESKCEVCGKCTNKDCTEQACLDKCDCPVIPPHTCESVCPICNKCLNKDCTDEACKDKCLGHTPPHVCESVCETCHKCKNADCEKEVCKEKCTCPAVPVHECQHVCEVCGKCTNKDCTEQACLEKCDCPVIPPHTCESVCPICNKCLNKDCTEDACKDKCLGHTPPHVCESVCEICHKCKNADCQEEACKEKCTCPAVPAHECQHVCEVCGKCTNKECTEQACLEKCDCPVIPPHVCENKCPICGKCLNKECTDEACKDKCLGHTPPHTCESVCETCHKCKNADCQEEACKEKCTCQEVPPEPIMHTVKYIVGEGGTIRGSIDLVMVEDGAIQMVEDGRDAKPVSIAVKPGYQFWCWSDRPYAAGSGQSQRQETNVTQDITVTAIFKPCSYLYGCYSIGKIVYNGEEAKFFEVFMNPDGTFDEVSAGPVEDMVFTHWSDGVTTAVRHDSGAFVGKKVLYAYFEVRKVRTVTYSVYDNFGGRIEGDTEQSITLPGNSTPVRAVADDGYIFLGWSDLSTEPQRYEENVEKNVEFVAFFESLEKTFTYNYNGANQPLQPSVTLKRDGNLTNIKFSVPEKAGYTFCGWYLEPEYKTKVADENGKYFLGYEAFSTAETEIYAKWQKADEERTLPVYKVLIIINDSVVARLWSSVTQDYIDVNYKMTTSLRRTLRLVSAWFNTLLNDWFAGEVIFDVDTFFTTEPLTPQSHDPDKWDGVKPWMYSLFAADVPQVADIYQNYNSRLLVYKFDAEEKLMYTEGHGTKRDGNVCLETLVTSYGMPMYYKTAGMNQIMTEDPFVLGILIHEFCHTVEQQVIEAGEYHSFLFSTPMSQMQESKVFLRDETHEYGIHKGLPQTFWEMFR